MEGYRNLFLHNNDGLDEFLVAAIAFIFAGAVLFFLLTVFRKLKKRRQDLRKKSYYAFFTQLFAKMLFQDMPVKDAVGILRATFPEHNILLKKVAIKSLTSLHRSYAGQYKKMLEDFYVESDLHRYSLAKLRRDDWHAITEGLRELAYFGYHEAEPQIRKFVKDRNAEVRKEALVSLAELQGVEALAAFKDTATRLDDWTQSRILHSIIARQLAFAPETAKLLEASNPTFVLLGARLVAHFQQVRYLPLVEAAADRITSSERAELLTIVQNFQTLH